MSRLDLSVVILTFNEEENLPPALKSVCGWAKEIFVVDSLSTDRTVDVALARSREGVTAVQHPFENYSAQWNWAITRLPFTSGWTLKLDADERVTPEFRAELESLLPDLGADVDGVLFRRRLVFMGKGLRFGGLTDNFDLRCWRTGAARFDGRPVNEHPLVAGRMVEMRSFVEHHDTRSLSHWIEKHNRYSSLEAITLVEHRSSKDELRGRLFGNAMERRAWLRRVYYKVPLRHLVYFLYRYVARLGFLDGRAGLAYPLLQAIYFYWIDLKMFELRERGVRPLVTWPPRGSRDPRLAILDDSRGGEG